VEVDDRLAARRRRQHRELGSQPIPALRREPERRGLPAGGFPESRLREIQAVGDPAALASLGGGVDAHAVISSSSACTSRSSSLRTSGCCTSASTSAAKAQISSFSASWPPIPRLLR